MVFVKTLDLHSHANVKVDIQDLLVKHLTHVRIINVKMELHHNQ